MPVSRVCGLVDELWQKVVALSERYNLHLKDITHDHGRGVTIRFQCGQNIHVTEYWLEHNHRWRDEIHRWVLDILWEQHRLKLCNGCGVVEGERHASNCPRMPITYRNPVYSVQPVFIDGSQVLSYDGGALSTLKSTETKLQESIRKLFWHRYLQNKNPT